MTIPFSRYKLHLAGGQRIARRGDPDVFVAHVYPATQVFFDRMHLAAGFRVKWGTWRLFTVFVRRVQP